MVERYKCNSCGRISFSDISESLCPYKGCGGSVRILGREEGSLYEREHIDPAVESEERKSLELLQRCIREAKKHKYAFLFNF